VVNGERSGKKVKRKILDNGMSMSGGAKEKEKIL
jgi:hypothetical protein